MARTSASANGLESGCREKPEASLELLDLDGRAGLLELRLDLVGLLLVHALLDRLGRRRPGPSPP